MRGGRLETKPSANSTPIMKPKWRARASIVSRKLACDSIVSGAFEAGIVELAREGADGGPPRFHGRCHVHDERRLVDVCRREIDRLLRPVRRMSRLELAQAGVERGVPHELAGPRGGPDAGRPGTTSGRCAVFRAGSRRSARARSRALCTSPPSPKSSVSRNSAPRISAGALRLALARLPRRRAFPSRRESGRRCRSGVRGRGPEPSVPAQVSSMSSGCAAIARMSTGIGLGLPSVGNCCALERARRGLADRVERSRGRTRAGERAADRAAPPELPAAAASCPAASGAALATSSFRSAAFFIFSASCSN